MSHPVYAQPYGVGKYGANVPYGSQTSLTISTSGNVPIPITPTPTGTLELDGSDGYEVETGTSAVTVTSSDVVGYKLYIKSVNTTNLVNGGVNIAASGSSSPAELGVNTWGYNTDASNNFVGTTLADVLIKTGTGPHTSGDVTNVTFGVKIDNAKPAGNYSNVVEYTAVPQTN